MAFRFFQNGVHDLYGSASGKIDRDLSFHTIRIRIAEFGIRTSRNLLTRINLSHMVNGHVWSHMVTMVIYGHIWSSVSSNYILCKTWFVRKSSASWSKANSLVNSSLYFAFSKNPFNSPNERTPDLHHHKPGCILLLRSNSAQHFHLFSFIFESISNTN